MVSMLRTESAKIDTVSELWVLGKLETGHTIISNSLWLLLVRPITMVAVESSSSILVLHQIRAKLATPWAPENLPNICRGEIENATTHSLKTSTVQKENGPLIERAQRGRKLLLKVLHSRKLPLHLSCKSSRTLSKAFTASTSEAAAVGMNSLLLKQPMPGLLAVAMLAKVKPIPRMRKKGTVRVTNAADMLILKMLPPLIEFTNIPIDILQARAKSPKQVSHQSNYI
jgi:hypothetical protein